MVLMQLRRVVRQPPRCRHPPDGRYQEQQGGHPREYATVSGTIASNGHPDDRRDHPYEVVDPRDRGDHQARRGAHEKPEHRRGSPVRPCREGQTRYADHGRSRQEDRRRYRTVMEPLDSARQVLVARVEKRTRSLGVEDVLGPVRPRSLRRNEIRHHLANHEGHRGVERTTNSAGDEQVGHEDKGSELDRGGDPGGHTEWDRVPTDLATTDEVPHDHETKQKVDLTEPDGHEDGIEKKRWQKQDEGPAHDAPAVET